MATISHVSQDGVTAGNAMAIAATIMFLYVAITGKDWFGQDKKKK